MIWSKARLEFLAFLLLAGSGLALRHPALLVLAIPLFWHLVVGLAFGPKKPGEKLGCRRRVQPKRLYENGVLEVLVEIKNQGNETLDVIARDGPYPGLAVVAGQAWAMATLKPGETLSISYRVRAARGVYHFRGVAVEVRDPLGLAPWRGELPCPGEAVVLPRYEDLVRLELAARRTLPIPGTARSRRGGVGLEFHGVREFRPGDEIKRIAWKAYARLGVPVVVEYEQERAADVAIILDVRARAWRGTPPELFEHAVRAAAALAHHHLRQGHRVGLLKYGAYLDWLFPGYGRTHGELILRELAKAKLGESEVFAELHRLPTRLMPAGSLLILVSPLILGDEEVLGRLVARGYRVFVVLPDPTAVELPETPEAALARRILALERWALFGGLGEAG